MKSVLLCGWSGPRFVSKSGGRFRDVNLLGQQDAHLIFLLWSGAMAMVSGVDVLGVPPPSPRPPVALQTLPLCPGLPAATRACSALEEPCNECPRADFIRYPQEFTDAPLCPFAVAGTLDHRVSRHPPWWLDWQHTLDWRPSLSPSPFLDPLLVFLGSPPKWTLTLKSLSQGMLLGSQK